jgi:glucose dehydrogenase
VITPFAHREFFGIYRVPECSRASPYRQALLQSWRENLALGYDGDVKEFQMHVRFVLAFLIAARVVAQSKVGDWPMYNHDIGSTRYSALNQITTTNVGKLWGHRSL